MKVELYEKWQGVTCILKLLKLPERSTMKYNDLIRTLGVQVDCTLWDASQATPVKLFHPKFDQTCNSGNALPIKSASTTGSSKTAAVNKGSMPFIPPISILKMPPALNWKSQELILCTSIFFWTGLECTHGVLWLLKVDCLNVSICSYVDGMASWEG